MSPYSEDSHNYLHVGIGVANASNYVPEYKYMPLPGSGENTSGTGDSSAVPDSSGGGTVIFFLILIIGGAVGYYLWKRKQRIEAEAD